jgi:hypothetical protein
MLYRIGLSAALVLAASAFAFAADDKKETPKVEEGKPAPDITLEATQINTVLPDKKDAKTLSLKDFRGEKGKNVVLFFFPKAMTRG